MRQILILALILSLAGCAAGNKATEGDAVEIPLCDCKPYPKPGQIMVKQINPVKQGVDGWYLDNESYLNNGAFWQEVKRYIGDTDKALQYWYDCVSACNVEYKRINELD